MRITPLWLPAVVATGTLSLAAPAAADDPAFHIVSVATQECLHLRTPDKPGGGGLELKPCKALPDFAFSVSRSTTEVTEIMVKLTSTRSVCVVASDEPGAGTSKPLPVHTVDCGGLGSLWFQSGDPSERVFRKADRTQTPAGCLQVNPTSQAIEIDLCQELPRQQWKLEALP